jgi:hypothetical protein
LYLGDGVAAGGGVYTFAWNTTGATLGLHNLTVMATDNLDFAATSAPATVVNVGLAPTVSITSPTSTFTATQGNSVSLAATASTSNVGGSIAGVAFYDNGSLLGSAGAGAGTWTLAWSTASATIGLHNLTAVGTDDGGRTATSAPATVINVTSPTGPPAVAITTPTGTLIAAIGGMIPMVATASTTNPGGSISSVQFYDGGTLMGSGVLHAGTWTYLMATTLTIRGAHTITAVATDNAALTGTSAPATILFRMLGDANGDGFVDGQDYGIWQGGYGKTGQTFATGDFNLDGFVDGQDYGIWQSTYGRVLGASAASDGTEAASIPMASIPASPGSGPRLLAVAPAAGAVASGVTSLTLVFDSPVTVSAGAVEVSGLATGSHQDYTAVYNAATNTLTLTFAAALPADQYSVRVISSFVVAADGGAPLDGETGNPAAATLPSGDGTPGGDARIVFVAE